MTFIPQSRFSVLRELFLISIGMYLMMGALRHAQSPINQSTNHYVRLHRSNTNDDGVDRRGFLKCMAWAGTGIICPSTGGLLTSRVFGAEDSQNAIATAELNFVQLSDSQSALISRQTRTSLGPFGDDYARQRVT